MCDYSLHNVKTRPAKVGDKLITRQFSLGTRGFYAPEDASVAVCVLPGTELSFAEEVRRVTSWPWTTAVIGHKAAIFRQINQNNPAESIRLFQGGIKGQNRAQAVPYPDYFFPPGAKTQGPKRQKKIIGQQEIANQSNDAFGYHCALDELYGLGFDHYKRLEHDVNAVFGEFCRTAEARVIIRQGQRRLVPPVAPS